MPWPALRVAQALQMGSRLSHNVAPMSSTISTHVYEVRPCKDHRGVDLISEALPFGRLWV
jgi:hypothetical protein